MGSDRAHRHLGVDDHISIHAPRMGSDGGGKHHRSWTNISIHAPRMGSDGIPLDANRISSRFQSTLPGWGATSSWSPASTRVRHFNPRSPDGERPMIYFSFSSVALFQSTLPGWGATSPLAACRRHRRHFNPRSPDGERLAVRSPKVRVFAFQSTLPGWGATAGQQVRHALAVQFQSTLPGWGATDEWRNPLPTPQNFNPRSPDGERPDRPAQ